MRTITQDIIYINVPVLIYKSRELELCTIMVKHYDEYYVIIVSWSFTFLLGNEN